MFRVLRRFKNGARPCVTTPRVSMMPPKFPNEPPKPSGEPGFHGKVDRMIKTFGLFCGAGLIGIIGSTIITNSQKKLNAVYDDDMTNNADVNWNTNDHMLCNRCCKPGHYFCPRHDMPRDY
jgi:hypothetical protein